MQIDVHEISNARKHRIVRGFPAVDMTEVKICIIPSDHTRKDVVLWAQFLPAMMISLLIRSNELLRLFNDGIMQLHDRMADEMADGRV